MFGYDANFNLMDIAGSIMRFAEHLRNKSYKVKDDWHRQILLRELYQQFYGIHEGNPSAKGDSLDLVRMSPKEGFLDCGPVQQAMEEFRLNNLKEHWGISVVEWLNMPRPYAMYLMKSSKALTDKHLKDITDSARDLENKMNGIK